MAIRTGVLPSEFVSFVSNPASAPFWEAAAEHRLVIPRCTNCVTFRFPPSAFCWVCRHQEVDWVEHDGNGELYSFTVMRHAVIPQVADALPIVIGVVGSHKKTPTAALQIAPQPSGGWLRLGGSF